MKILAIDTTTKKASVSLKIDNDVYTKSVDNEITHSEKLLPLIDDVLKEKNIAINEIDKLAVVQGPGSFTGVRIGIATIKAIAKVIDKNIVGITSLKLMALEALKKNDNKYILTLMDAKNDRVYYELFENRNSTLSSISFNGNTFLDDVLEQVNNMNLEDLLIVVDKDYLYEKINFKNCQIVPLNIENIFNDIKNLKTYDYLTLDAMYYRKSEAERTKYGE